MNTSLFGKINIRAAETLLLNGGKTTFGAKERAGRFYKNPYTASTSEINDYNQGCQGTLKTLKKAIVGKKPRKRREERANFWVFKVPYLNCT